MARVAGVDLPPNKRLWIGLTAIYGIGQARARELAEKANVDATKATARPVRTSAAPGENVATATWKAVVSCRSITVRGRHPNASAPETSSLWMLTFRSAASSQIAPYSPSSILTLMTC